MAPWLVVDVHYRALDLSAAKFVVSMEARDWRISFRFVLSCVAARTSGGWLLFLLGYDGHGGIRSKSGIRTNKAGKSASKLRLGKGKFFVRVLLPAETVFNAGSEFRKMRRK